MFNHYSCFYVVRTT